MNRESAAIPASHLRDVTAMTMTSGRVGETFNRFADFGL